MTGDMSKAHIIFLNGTSSAGKGSIAAALLESLPTPYVHVGFDDFIRLTRSPAYYGEQGFQLLEENDGLGARYTMAIGALGERFFSGMHHAVASFAAAGNNLIVDTVLWDRTWFGGVMSRSFGHSTCYLWASCARLRLWRSGNASEATA